MKYQAPYGSTDPDASYVDRNTPGAVAGSKVPAAAIEHPQREIASVITKAGLTASADDLMQLAKAMRSLRLNHVPATLVGSALSVTLDPAPASYDELRVLWVVPSAANAAGALTININGLGVLPVKVAGVDPPPAALKAGVPAMLVRTTGGYALIGFDAAGGRLLRTRVYTLVAGTQYVQVDGGAPTTSGATSASPLEHSVWAESEVQGGGSGCPATDSTSQSAAGGGSSGAWAIKRTTAAALSGQSVTVGAGGAGGAAGPNPGANGGASSVGAIVSALGGICGTSAGPSGPAGNFYAIGGAAPAAGTSGDMNLPGVLGAYGSVAGGQGVPVMAAPGRAFGGYFGSGGGSQSSLASTPARPGIAGTPGVVIIREYA